MVLSSEKPAVISKADEKDNNEPGLIHAFSNSVSEFDSLAKKLIL